MPTVLLLDSSLSMNRLVEMPDCTEEFSRRHLAIHGINTLLDYCTSHCKLEFISLMTFSAQWQQAVGFTRDFDSIKTTLNNSVEHNKTCIEAALAGVSSLVLEEWGTSTPCQVILITDGSVGIGEGSLKNSLSAATQRTSTEDKFPLPFRFPCKLHIVCLALDNDPLLPTALPLYQKLLEMNGKGGGEIFQPEGGLHLASVQKLFTHLAEKHLAPMSALLKCGNLKCNVSIFPAPDKYEKDHDFEHMHKEVSSTIELCGFVDISDIASPACISRHLVLPLPTTSYSENGNVEKGENGEPEEEMDDGKMAAFTVLLHGSLKVEGMVALTQLAEDWYGMMYSFADSKKKSNLMLSIFQPGAFVLPWLGNFSYLAPIGDFSEPPYGEEDNRSPFPVRPQDRRSYAMNCVVWIKPNGLQADIQKILRHARKLPEKQQHFYKELNRLRRAALSFGFHELLDAVSSMLERECTLLPGTAHPDAALQLTHAANALRGEIAKDVSQTVMPLRTNFSGD